MKRRDFIKGTLAAGGAVAAQAFDAPRVSAQARADLLLDVAENGPNSLDFHVVGANRPVYGVVWNVYDRLITFGVTKDANGNDYYDPRNLQPELAEEWDLRDTSVTLKLRKDVTFADGTPLTAKDVKWSFDRCIAVGGYPKSAVAPASLVDREQFVVVDDHTFRVDFIQHDKLTMPYLGVPLFGIYHSELVKKHATPEDPWGLEWTKFNTAGTGAFHIEKWTPGQELIYARNDVWKCGLLPKLRRIVNRVVPSAGIRRALIERGDFDIYLDVPAKDAAEMADIKHLKIVGSLMENSVQHISMNVKMKPFDNLKVRRAVAYAIPYEAIMKAAMYGRARPLFGGPDRVTTPEWPQPHRYVTDVAKAKQLLAEAGYPDGSRPRCRSILAMRPSTSRSACFCARGSLRSASRRRSIRWRAPIGARFSRRSFCRYRTRCSGAGSTILISSLKSSTAQRPTRSITPWRTTMRKWTRRSTPPITRPIPKSTTATSCDSFNWRSMMYQRSPCSSRSSTWRCSPMSMATATCFTGSSITGTWRRRELGHSGRPPLPSPACGGGKGGG